MLFSYLLISGVTTGALYALVALGLVVVNKATGIINFAQGEFFMFSGFVAWVLHVQLGLNYAITFLLTIAIGFGLGALTDRIAFRPIAKTDIVSLVLATVGIAFVLKGVARVLWGGKGDYLSFPSITSTDPMTVVGLMVIPQQLAVLAGTLVILILFAAFFRLTRAGKMMQATADNAKAAVLVGIRTDKIYTLAFGTGAAIAAAAAVLTAPITLLYPDLGFPIFLKGFAAAVMGGLMSLPGAVLGENINRSNAHFA
ncbi:MAG: branched-chain amino acid ABC transporter permease, partial [Alcaligenaceae bacterium]